jgi:hypothetical protein
MRNLTSLALLAAFLGIPGPATSGEPAADAPGSIQQVVFGTPRCCGVCESKCRCHKHTEIVCEMKKVPMTRWTYECEDVCTLLPGVMFGLSPLHSSADSCADKCADGCCEGCRHGVDADCPPRPGKCRTVKHLVMEEYTVEMPVYKCVVRYCCKGCGDTIADGSTDAKEKTADTATPEKTPRVAMIPRHVTGYGE